MPLHGFMLRLGVSGGACRFELLAVQESGQATLLNKVLGALRTNMYTIASISSVQNVQPASRQKFFTLFVLNEPHMNCIDPNDASSNDSECNHTADPSVSNVSV